MIFSQLSQSQHCYRVGPGRSFQHLRIGRAHVRGYHTARLLPSLPNTLTLCKEVNINDMNSSYTADVRTFAGNPIRLFLDNLLPVAICSFKCTTERSDFDLEFCSTDMTRALYSVRVAQGQE